ncbi:hypothetical protein Q1695_006675 [Nippostrongylus brasiliensis]|nr:hypothetical protein Q1695_006675 [Nippostrongylus brasiliensis]
MTERSTTERSLIEDETIADRSRRSDSQRSTRSARSVRSARSSRNANEKAQVYRFVKRTMEKGVHGLKKEFASLKRVNNFAIMRTFVANNALGRNRYKDVGCLDATRVRLTYNDGNDYIHANYVGTPSNSRRFICTQAPLDKTCRDFWMMCIQNRVEFIVMLCDLVEKGAKKCCQYYPLRGSISFGDITIAIVDSKLMRFTTTTNIRVNISSLIVEQRGAVLRVRHIHWVDWPDRGVPPADTAIIQVLEIMRDTQ